MECQRRPRGLRLPEDVVRLVVLALAGPPAGPWGQEPVRIRDVLSVCRQWRGVGLSIYAARVVVAAPAERCSLYWARNSLSPAKVRALGWQRYVREVAVIVSSRSAALGEPHGELSRLAGELAGVVHVRVHFRGSGAEDVRPRAADAPLDPVPVLAAVNTAFPSARRIAVEASNTRVVSSNVQHPCSRMHDAQAACRKAGQLDIAFCPAFVLPAAEPAEIQSLMLRVSEGSLGSSLAVVKRYAQSLRQLEIRYLRVGACMDILNDSRGHPLVYAQLEELTLAVPGAYDQHELQHRQAPPGCPFPSLRYLRCDSVYPFANDVLVRGAQRSLRKLAIAIDSSVAGWLLPQMPIHGSGGGGGLKDFALLACFEAHVIVRGGSNIADYHHIHARILEAATSAPNLNRLRVHCPNACTAEYKRST